METGTFISYDWIVIIIAYGCVPFDYNAIAQNVALQSHYAFGENTLKSEPISISEW